MAERSTRRVILLGSTGSIGAQTIEVIDHLNALHARGAWPTRFEVVGLAAGRRGAEALRQAAALGVRELALADGAPETAREAERAGVRVWSGPDGAEELVRAVEADLVVSAIVGSAGLGATLAAVELGRDVALANKETLVAAGALVVPAARRAGAGLLPVDSEHSAIWQCFDKEWRPPCALDERVARITLTASGGPFRTRSAREVYDATPEQALAHPTWSMGAKVTVDSASLTNKALELIEAHWLFGVGSDRLAAVVHPQSIVHSFVEMADGSVLAQLGAPDMRTPIQCALTFPRRASGVSRKLDVQAMGRLDFEPVDAERFPAVGAAARVIDGGGSAGAVFNAANEEAVGAFLARRIPFGRIGELSLGALAEVGVSPLRSLADVAEAEREARAYVRTRLDGAAQGRGATGRPAAAG